MTSLQLKDILDAVRNSPDVAPHDGKTFCNIAVDRVFSLCGIKRIVSPINGQPMMANDIIDYMEANNDKWTKVNADVACGRASQGIVVVACQHEDMHGHIAIVYPAPMAYSGSWAKDVPLLSNVGKVNAILRASQAFRTEPNYYSVKI